MKVLIDIPEEDYKLACSHPEALIDCYARYIKAGTPIIESRTDNDYEKAVDQLQHDMLYESTFDQDNGSM